MTAGSMTDRMLGALRLQTATYEEIEADQKATGEAAFIIVATSLVSGAVNGVLTGASDGLRTRITQSELSGVGDARAARTRAATYWYAALMTCRRFSLENGSENQWF